LTPKNPSLSCVTLKALREARGLTQGELSRRAGVSKKMLSLYETEKAPPHERLVSVLAAMGYELAEFDFALHGLTQAVGPREAPRSPVDPDLAEMKSVQQVAVRVGQASADLTERHLVNLVRSLRARKERRQALRLWETLKRGNPHQRRLLVTRSRQFQTWGLAELLSHKSEEAASDRADRALELAKLACQIAELAPGEEGWRSRLQGYCLAFLANARRVANDLVGAEEDFGRGWKLWEAGAVADPGLLEEWRLPYLEASLCRDLRRFAEALALLDRARAVAPREACGRILLKKAFTFQQREEAERAIETLREAEPFVDSQRDPHLRYSLRMNLASSLCDLGRHTEVKALLPEVRELAVGLRKELDLVRVVWLTGRLHAGLGRTAEAHAAFEQVRREFTDRGMAFDCALVNLDLSVLLLEQGRAGEVQTLAEEMLWIFKAQGIHREALAALTLFREAARKEEATLKLVRRLIGYLNRAKSDPDLRFEP
jgi:tetratricopeptide (TPR) repeat protein/DNA-binding XRE family transcriptional regulator